MYTGAYQSYGYSTSRRQINNDVRYFIEFIYLVEDLGTYARGDMGLGPMYIQITDLTITTCNDLLK